MKEMKKQRIISEHYTNKSKRYKMANRNYSQLRS
jgi:hypothetical protein